MRESSALGAALDVYDQWCEDRGASHAHCPLECDHPQPFIHDGKLVCGCCLIMGGIVTEMVPCTPEVCS